MNKALILLSSGIILAFISVILWITKRHFSGQKTFNIITITVTVVSLLLMVVSLVLYLVPFSDSAHQNNNHKKKNGFPDYMSNSSPYAPTSSDGFGTKISELAQSPQFYEKHYDATINYLGAVYPLGIDSFKQLTPLQLASFYNSLTFYYNCEFQYHDDDLGILPGLLPPTWNKLPCASKTPLPYPPQGIFYNFYTYQKYNIPYVSSNSDGTIKYLDLSNFGNCRVGVDFITTKNEQKGSIRPGPGMFWVNCRTIQRHIWYPNGFKVSPGISQKTDDDFTLEHNQPILWNWPTRWFKGFGDNEFIEVTHFFHGPGGMTTSPGWWFNGFFGTGMFLNLGKTKVVNNKIDAVLQLANELAKNQSGRLILQTHFNTVDPYMVVWKFQTSACDNNGQQLGGFCSNVLNCCTSGGADVQKGLPGVLKINNTNNFWKETVRYQNDKGINQTTPTYRGIRMAIDAAARNSDFNLSRFSVNILSDEPMFFMGIKLGYDTIQLWIDPNSNGYFVYELIDLRLPPKYREAVNNRDYSQMIDIYHPYTNGGNPWNKTFMDDSISYLVSQKLISVRDPLDVYNESKSKSCNGLLTKNICPNNTDQPGDWYNLYCADIPLANDYKCLGIGYDAQGSVCKLNISNPTC